MFVSIYYKPSLFNAHTMILIVHIFMNVNKLCLNQVILLQHCVMTENKSDPSDTQLRQAVFVKFLIGH